MAEFFQVLTMMAAPAAIFLLIRHLIVRQNRIAQATSQPPARGAGRQPPDTTAVIDMLIVMAPASPIQTPNRPGSTE